MYTLFIDTHLWDIIIILLKDGKVVNKEEVINKKNNSEYIFPSIIKVIDKVKLDEIIVVNGPGSFTGVRLGVTITKTFAYTLNIPIKVITSLEVMEITYDNPKVAFSDNNGYYLANFTNKDNIEYKYITEDEFDLLKDKDEYITKYEIDIEKVYEFLKDRKAINPHEANPIYVKKIGVEIDKKSN